LSFHREFWQLIFFFCEKEKLQKMVSLKVEFLKIGKNRRNEKG